MGVCPSRLDPEGEHEAPVSEVQTFVGRGTPRHEAPASEVQTFVGRGTPRRAGAMNVSLDAWQGVPGAANLRWRATDNGKTVLVACDLSQNFGPSSTGKTITVASSHGNRSLAQSGLLLSMNAYSKADIGFDVDGLADFRPWQCSNMDLALEGTEFIITADVSNPGEASHSAGHMMLVAGTLGNRQVGNSHVTVTCNLMTKTGESVDHAALAAYSVNSGVEDHLPPHKRRRTDDDDDDDADDDDGADEDPAPPADEDALDPADEDPPAPVCASEFTSAFFGGARSDNYASLEILAAFLEEATSTLEVAVFNLTDNRLAGVLLDKHAAGVKVRVIADNGMEEKYEDSTGDLQRLREAGIPVLCDRSDLHMHDKFAVVDGRAVANGSFNWTTGAVLRNKENVVINRRASMAECFLSEFERLWNKFGSPPQTCKTFADKGRFEDGVACLFFPDLDDENFRIFLEELGTAKVSLHICLFVITLPEVVEALSEAHARGCSVRVITDDHMAKTHKGEHVTALREAGIEVRTDDSPANMHHKFGVVDNVKLINGSFNWTRQAEDGNNENMIIYRDEAELAAAFVAEFEDLWLEFA